MDIRLDMSLNTADFFAQQIDIGVFAPIEICPTLPIEF
jgi:hypothetical protein